MKKKILSNRNIMILAIGLFTGIGLSTFSIFLTEQSHEAQATPQGGVNVDGQKIFGLGHALQRTIDPTEYQDGSIVQYNIGIGLPTITIENWNNLKALDKAQIESQAISDNWDDITCLISLCI
jgi:hypothetical protein